MAELAARSRPTRRVRPRPRILLTVEEAAARLMAAVKEAHPTAAAKVAAVMEKAEAVIKAKAAALRRAGKGESA
jgi:hypothetical protein